MKNIILLSAALILIQTIACSQIIPEKGKNLSPDIEINWLMIYKREYEKYSHFAEISEAGISNKYIFKRDSVFKLYKDQLQMIYKSPNIYIKHIEEVINGKKLEYDGAHRMLYDYVNFSLPHNEELHFISRVELYKIIKRYIFEGKGSFLPHRTDAYIKDTVIK